MGAPLGNKNAAKNKVWEGAIRRAVLANDGAELRELAEKLVARAKEGDIAAMREIGDRLDGKPNQTHEVSADLTVIVAPSDANL